MKKNIEIKNIRSKIGLKLKSIKIRIFLTFYFIILYLILFRNIFKNINQTNDELNVISNKTLIELIKNNIENKTNKTNIDTVLLTSDIKTGNYMIALSNAIYYCEILKCKYIIHNQKMSKNFFTKPIIYKKYNITLLPHTNVTCKDNNTLCNAVFFFYYHYQYSRNGIRYNLIKNEFNRNLENIKINDDDLYIHIRSGDIFLKGINPFYSQPPFCFYEYIIKNYKFKNIYILTEKSKNNPVITEITKKFPNVKVISGELKHDVNIIVYAKNLVISNSSFSRILIEFSNSLKNLFVFDYVATGDLIIMNYKKNYKKKYNTYEMKPTFEYLEKMSTWKNTKSQIEILRHSKCNQKLIKHNAIFK